jgi:uncharacterized membrane protein YfcA
MTALQGVVLFVAATLAGAINAVAGGGTLVTFPALVWSGLEERIANATSTVSLWPGSIGGMWGYRRELRGTTWWIVLLLPSLLGGTAGALLLLATPASAFRAIVPYLVLSATCLFMLQGTLSRLRTKRASPSSPSAITIGVVIILQAAIATYGGYFGAGIGILMLAVLSLLQIESVHELNGVKTLLAACINGIAAACFVYAGAVNWPRALIMIAGSITGGYGGASIARQLGQKTVRAVVVAIGFCITAWMLYRQVFESK